MTDKWKDISSHRQNETPEQQSAITAVEFRGKNIRVRVHHHMDYPRDQWLMTCYFDDIDMEPLPEEKLKDAKQLALGVARARLQGMLYEVEKELVRE
jgi:hypothetical protein